MRKRMLVQMVLFFSISISSSTRKDIKLFFYSLKVLISPFILGNIKTSGDNYIIIIKIPNFLLFFLLCKILLLLLLSYQVSTLMYYQKLLLSLFFSILILVVCQNVFVLTYIFCNDSRY